MEEINIQYSIEAEQMVLGALFISSESMDKIISIIKPEDFFLEEHRYIASAMWHVKAKDDPIDIVVVSEQLKADKKLEMCGGVTYLAKLAGSVPDAANIVYYAKIVKRYSLTRELNVYLSGLDFNPNNLSEKIEDIRKKIEKLQSSLIFESDEKDINDFAKDLIEKKLNSNVNEDENVLKTEYRLDQVIGGLKPGQLVTIAGRPGVGKTTFAINILNNVCFHQKKPALFVTLEMTEEQIWEKLICINQKIGIMNMEMNAFTLSDMKKLDKFYADIEKNPLVSHIKFPFSSSLNDVVSLINNFYEKNGIKLVIIDYLQLIEVPGARGESRAYEIAEVTRTLKNLAGKLGISIIVLSQLSRAIEKRDYKVPMLSDLRDSGAIEQDSDVVMFLHNKYAEAPFCVSGYLAKNRHGPNDEYLYTFCLDWGRFFDVDA